MSGKLPPDAFYYYFSLGPSRSYQAVAEKYGVSKRAVTSLAARENWQHRVEELERKAREGTERKVVESLELMNERHLKAYRVLQRKALEALMAMGIDSAMDAARALDTAIRGERLVSGEPSERTALKVEDIIRREYERWMVPDETTDGDAQEGRKVEGDRGGADAV